MRHKAAYPKPPFPRQSQPKPGMESKLQGRRALITGGDSGIGRAVAEQGRRCVLVPGDVGDPEFCRHAVERAARELGGLDILVNNAAYQSSHESLESLSDEEWDRTFRVNIHAYFYLAKAALKKMRPGSCIINCGSVVGFRGSRNLLDYGATKGAIHAFTKSLALNLVSRGIRVNAVAPGPVWTPLNAADRPPEAVAEFGRKTPMKRPAQPEEVAPAFVFLASEADSSYITGEVLPVTGGET